MATAGQILRGLRGRSKPDARYAVVANRDVASSQGAQSTAPAVSPVGSAVGPGSSGARLNGSGMLDRPQVSVTADFRPLPALAPGAVLPCGVGGFLLPT